MSSKLEFYKQFYLKELSARTELNNAVTTPVAILTVVVTLHVYMFNAQMALNARILLMCIASANLPFIIRSIYYLGKSFTNLGKAHTYREIAGMLHYYEYNEKLEQAKTPEHFDVHLEKELAACASHNFEINKKRIEDMASAKKALFVSVSLAFIFSIVYVATLITNINMATPENNQGGGG
jgi:hypothetical protein